MASLHFLSILFGSEHAAVAVSSLSLEVYSHRDGDRSIVSSISFLARNASQACLTRDLDGIFVSGFSGEKKKKKISPAFSNCFHFAFNLDT